MILKLPHSRRPFEKALCQPNLKFFQAFRGLKRHSGLSDRWATLLICLIWGTTINATINTAVAQPVKPEIRIAIQEENPIVYVYHTALPPIGHGFNIYRKGLDEEEYTKLNQNPVRGVASGTELRALLGTLYDDIEHTTGQSTDNGTLTKLRSDFKTANLLTFIYPKIAEGLGRLYFDRNAPLDAPATYKIEFVDALDSPTGEVLEKTALLLPQKPDTPTHLRAQNQGNLITLFWRYIPPNETVDDKVIRFEAFRIDPTTNQHQRLSEKVILRNNALFEYALTFEVPTTGQTEQLYVQSVDITGQASEASTVLRYAALDANAPNLVIEVNTKPIANRRIQVTWQRASNGNEEADLAGYNVYRSTELNNDASYHKLNAQPLSFNESVFNDTLAVHIGSRVYFYRVKALDTSGNEGPFSTAAMALIEDREAPASPTQLEAVYSKKGIVELSWKNEEPTSDFKSFIVLRQRLGRNAPHIPSRINLDDLQESSFTDVGEAGKGFYEGVVYRFSVISVDHSGNFSEAITTDLHIPDYSAPHPPNGVQGIIESGSRIAIFWNPSKSNDVMSYIVYRRETGSSILKAVPLTSNFRRFEDEEVVSGTSYEYWVTAADSAGNESMQSTPHRIQMRDFSPPRNVRNIRIQAMPDGQVTLQWEPVSAFDMAGYVIYKSASINGMFEPVSSEIITENRWQDSANQGQCYRVMAIDTSGNESKPSQPACIGTTDSP